MNKSRQQERDEAFKKWYKEFQAYRLPRKQRRSEARTEAKKGPRNKEAEPRGE